MVELDHPLPQTFLLLLHVQVRRDVIVYTAKVVFGITQDSSVKQNRCYI
jgi:hypothetical protein